METYRLRKLPPKESQREVMKKSRFTETQTASLLSEADVGLKVQEPRRKHGIRPATYCQGEAKCGRG